MRNEEQGTAEDGQGRAGTCHAPAVFCVHSPVNSVSWKAAPYASITEPLVS